MGRSEGVTRQPTPPSFIHECILSYGTEELQTSWSVLFCRRSAHFVMGSSPWAPAVSTGRGVSGP